ncbi:DNA helicase [Tanacetum coccineum]
MGIYFTRGATPAELRTLFAHILKFCDVSNPLRLWKHSWESMSHDIPRAAATSLNIPGLQIDRSNLEGYVLYEVESYLNRCSKSLTDFGLPLPPEDLMEVLRKRLLMEERSYDRALHEKERDRLIPKLNQSQKAIFHLIVDVVYGNGGTGKTFLWKTIIYTLRSEGKIVLAIASSGITSLLLPSGRTAHSRFKLPLDLTDTERLCISCVIISYNDMFI